MKRFLSILVLLLALAGGVLGNVQSVYAMQQNFFQGGYATALPTVNGTTASYSIGSQYASTTNGNTNSVIPTAGTFSKLYVVVSVAPDNGVGTQSWDITLYINGAPSALTLNISEAETSDSDVAHSVDITAGDMVRITATANGAPAASSYPDFTLIFTGTTAGESIVLFRPALSISSTQYRALTGQSGESSVENVAKVYAPVSGTFKKMYVNLNGTDPGTAPDAYLFMLRVNNANSNDGSGNALSVTITADATTGNNTSYNISVSAGDTIDIQTIPQNTPAAAPTLSSIGMVFVSGTNGESIWTFSSIDLPSDSVSEYATLQTFSGAWNATETIVDEYSSASTFSKLWAYTPDGFSSGTRYYDIMLRANASSSSLTTRLGAQPNVAPNGDGDILGTWTKSTGSTYYGLVDEQPSADDGDYMTGTVLDAGTARNLFTFPAIDLPAGAKIQFVEVTARHREVTSSANDIARTLKVNGSYYSSSTSNPGSSWTTVTSVWVTNPASGAAWTVADIEGASSYPLQQFGVTSTDLTPNINVSWVFFKVVLDVNNDLVNSANVTLGQRIDYMSMPSGTPVSARMNLSVVAYINPTTYDISNSPTSKAFGVVAANSTYYAFGSAPSNPLQDSEATFTITNNGIQADLDMKITDFTGGVGWNIVSSAPGSNEVRITAYYSGQNPASGLVLANTDAEFLDAFAASSTKKWDFKFETGTFTDGVAKSATLTITARAET